MATAAADREQQHRKLVEFWLFEQGLYARIQASNGDGREQQRLLRTFEGTVDSYCPGCGREATFRGRPSDDAKNEQLNQHASILTPVSASRGGGGFAQIAYWDSSDFEVDLICTRQGHLMRFYFHWDAAARKDELGTLQKIGQFPSFADLSFPDTKRFRALLGQERYAEYHRGLGLFAHGVNIGAFIYLRRILESLVEEAHAEESVAAGWDEAVYQNAKMDQRIALLAHRLPATLVENAGTYGILSKGVHQLTEEECGRYFQTVHAAIELILSEKLQQKERERRVSEVRSAVAAATGELRKA